MKRLLIKLTSALLALLLVACDGNDSTGPGMNNARAVLIFTAKAEITTLQIRLKSVGQVHARSAPTLAAEVEGRITAVSVDAGESIEQGQLLAQTDTSTLLLERQAAQAGLERLVVHINNGKRRVERFAQLSSKNLASQTQLDDAREQLEAYQADYKAAAAQLAIVNDSISKSRIIAPISGVIQERFIATGDFVKRGQALFAITNPNQLQAWLPYPETDIARIHPGQLVSFKSPLIKGVVFQGVIKELKPALDSGSRAVMTITEIENPGKLRPEATISGKVLVETRQQAVMVPVLSVVRRPVGEVVYIIKGNRAIARQVSTGQNEAGRVEITAGLKGNETIATEGAAFLTDGARVKIAEPED